MDKDFSGVVKKVFVQGNDGAMHHLDGGHCKECPEMNKHIEPTHVHQNREDRNSKVGNVKLTSKARKNLKSSTFVFPGERRYPIPDASHGRNALARVAQHGSSSEKAKVRAAVHRKFPGIGKA